jgi:hypothetical protein
MLNQMVSVSATPTLRTEFPRSTGAVQAVRHRDDTVERMFRHCRRHLASWHLWTASRGENDGLVAAQQ